MAIWQYGKIDIAKQKKEKEEDWIITEHALSHALGRQSKTTRERFSSIEHNTTTQDKDTLNLQKQIQIKYKYKRVLN